MGLDDSYKGMIGQILMKRLFLGMNEVFSIIHQEKKEDKYLWILQPTGPWLLALRRMTNLLSPQFLIKGNTFVATVR